MLLLCDLVYFMEGMEYFDDYLKVVVWVQFFVSFNCDVMMENVVMVL